MRSVGISRAKHLRLWLDDQQWRTTFDYDVPHGTEDDGLTPNLEPTEEAP
jgi:hypothetical protein